MARVFVITGPSGVGKGTLIRGLHGAHAEARAVGLGDHARAPAGRARRRRLPLPHREEFDRRVASRRVRRARRLRRTPLRHAALRAREPRARGVPVVLEIEVQGARQVREAMPEAVQVFIAPPSLRGAAHAPRRPRDRRRRRRSSDACASPSRSSRAQPEFGHVVVNDRLDDALERLTAIVAASSAVRRGVLRAERCGRLHCWSNKERHATVISPASTVCSSTSTPTTPA